MDNVRKQQLEATRRAFLASTTENGFELFMNSLELDELEAYFYFEAKRSDSVIRHVTSMNGKTIGIEELFDIKNRKWLPKGFGFEKSIDKILNFWILYGRIKNVTVQSRLAVITKYNSFNKEFNKDEIEFFMEC